MTRAWAKADELTICTPPRFRWLIRISVGYTFLLAGLVGLWFWWDAHSHAMLDAKIAAYKAAGEPTRVEDFPLPRVADELNAARRLSDASLLVVDSLALNLPGIDDFFHYDLELSRGNFELLDALIRLNREPLCLIREARELGVADGTRFGIGTGPFATHRRLAKLEMAAALHAHIGLDDAQAIERLRDGMAVGRLVSGGAPPSVLNELVATAIDAMAHELIGPISGELQITDSAEAHEGPASREKIIELIQELLEDSEVRERMRRAFQRERIDVCTSLRQTAAGTGTSTPPGMWLLGPSLCVEGCALLDRLTEISVAVGGTDFHAARGRLGDWSAFDQTGGVERLRTIIRRMIGTSYDYCLVIQAARLAQRRMAATALAIRLFEIDHGRRPERLDELVPEYLPAVPIDPFRPDSGPIGYRLEEGRTRLYSIGDDGIDDGGIRKTPGGYRKEIILQIDPPEELPDSSEYYFPALLDDGRDEP